MSKVYFKINLKKDAENWWQGCNSSFMGIDWKLKIEPSLKKHIIGKSKEKAKKFLEPYLKKRYKEDAESFEKFKEAELFWKKIEKRSFNRLKKITKKSIYPKKIICYYTTFPRGMYRIEKDYAWMQLDPKEFLTKEFYSMAILHEIIHFQFHEYFWYFCKKRKLSDNQIHHIKEAVTFLINEEFLDLVKKKDRGYKIHEKFREDLTKIWKKEKDFKKLLIKATHLIKNKYKSLK